MKTSISWLRYLAYASILIFMFLMWNKLGRDYLFDWDEGIYGQIGLEMVKSRDYLTPTWNNELWLEKPPLIAWVTALGISLVGPTEFGARFLMPLFAGLTLYAIYRIGTKLGGALMGASSMAILGYFNLFLARARALNTDGMLLAGITWTVWLLLSHGPAWIVGLVMGLTILAKGPAGILAILITLPLPVSYTHLRAHETGRNLVCRLLLEKKKIAKVGSVAEQRVVGRGLPGQRVGSGTRGVHVVHVARPGIPGDVEALLVPRVRKGRVLREHRLVRPGRRRAAQQHRHGCVERLHDADVGVGHEEREHRTGLRLRQRELAGTTLRPAASRRLGHGPPVLRVVAVQIETADPVFVVAAIEVVVDAFRIQEELALPLAHAAHRALRAVSYTHLTLPTNREV